MSVAKQSIREKVVQAIKDHQKYDKKTQFVNPFTAEKSQVLLETRDFDRSPLDPQNCCKILTKVLHLITTGETLASQQTTELFFGITKLFQSSNGKLRRMVYLLIKTLKASDKEVFIVTSSLTKDMNCDNPCYRANAIRALSHVVEPSMAMQIERYLKTAIVDSNPFVASAALICGIHLLHSCPEVVRRWVNEVQQSVSSTYPMVQLHALQLLYEQKRSDGVALRKMLTSLKGTFNQSPFAECLLIRYVTDVIKSETDEALKKTFFEYLDSCLRGKSDMSVIEAAKAFTDLACCDQEGKGGFQIFGIADIGPAIKVLQLFLSSSKPILKLASIRSLNKLAQLRPQVLARAVVDIEPLLQDPNRHVASLALTTLLKTGHEASIDKLIVQITALMSELSDCFKIDIIEAVKQLTLTFPNKYKALMAFMATNLRDEGTFQCKKQTVEALITLSKEIPQAQEAGLLHLCEFIEDCEYASLCTQTLNFLGLQAPTTPNPSKYIRFIYNRLILENANIRAAGVHALARIAMRCPDLKRDILALLECCLYDNDDEVRERANHYYKSLEFTLSPIAEFSKEADEETQSDVSTAEPPPNIEDLLSDHFDFSIDAVCMETQRCVELDVPFDKSKLMTQEEFEKMEAVVKTEVESRKNLLRDGPITEKHVSAGVVTPATSEGLGLIVESLISTADLGILCHSCSSKELTEKEAEYRIKVTKNMFSKHVVLEFEITNTVPDQRLEHIDIKLKPSNECEASWKNLGCIPIEALDYDETKKGYVVLEKIPDDDAENRNVVVGTFDVFLTFLLKELGDDFGFDDEYSAEALVISIGDYAVPKQLRFGEFKTIWENLKTEGFEKIVKLTLNFRTIDAAVAGIIESFNLAPCEKTEIVDTTRTSHSLLLSGVFLNSVPVLCRGLLGTSPENRCLLKLAVRSRESYVCETLSRILD